MKNIKKTAATAALAAGLALAVAGCHVPGTNPAKNDLRNAGQTYPDHAVTILNVDGYPNVTVLCFQGTAFSTTTREYTALTLTPSLNAWCAGYKGQQTK